MDGSEVVVVTSEVVVVSLDVVSAVAMVVESEVESSAVCELTSVVEEIKDSTVVSDGGIVVVRSMNVDFSVVSDVT